VRTQPVADEAEVRAMLARMRRKTEEKVEVSHQSVVSSNGTAPEPRLTPQPEEPAGVVAAGSLHWKRGEDDWTILSTDGHYKIRKSCVEHATVHGNAEFSYECFRIVPNHWDLSIGRRRDPKEARACCEAHERQLTRKSA